MLFAFFNFDFHGSNFGKEKELFYCITVKLLIALKKEPILSQFFLFFCFKKLSKFGYYEENLIVC